MQTLNCDQKVKDSKEQEKPNILFITTDQQRLDSLGIYGNNIVQTPNIDNLGKNGVIYYNAFCQSPVCVPGRACISTGRYTNQHGVSYSTGVSESEPKLSECEKTFVEHLKEGGYFTAGFGHIQHVKPYRGFDSLKLTGGKGARWTQSSGLPIGPGPLGPEYEEWLEERHSGGYEMIYEQRKNPDYKKFKTSIENI